MRRESYPNRSNPPDRTGPAARGYRSAALRILKSDCSPARRYALRVSGRFRSRLEMRLSAYRGTGPFPTRVFYGWPGGGVGRCRNGNRSGGDRVRLDLARQIEVARRSEEHTSELQSLMRISYAVFCLKKKTRNKTHNIIIN